LSVILLSVLTALTSSKELEGTSIKEVYTGTIYGVGGRLGGVSRSFTLSIDDYTSSAEASRAINALAEGGQDALLTAIRGRRLGYFSLGSQLGRDINFVSATSTPDGGRHITILFERWMNLFEVRYGTRSENYPFSYLELTLDRTGRGEGTFIPAARVNFNSKDSDQIDIESFGVYPARLIGVERRN
jgi:hypothetical protein